MNQTHSNLEAVRFQNAPEVVVFSKLSNTLEMAILWNDFSSSTLYFPEAKLLSLCFHFDKTFAVQRTQDTDPRV